MSLANYLNRNKIITTEQIELTQEPNELGDGARISDTIVYKGNATYTINPPTTTLIGANQDFTPLFYDASGVSPPVADYLNVRPDEDLFNFNQLATIKYSVYVNSHSTFDFEYRIAFYDDDLQRISAYDPIVYDPSNNARDPPSIDGFTITGWSVEIPTSARYAFLEVKNNTSGSIELQFDYGNSQLENAVDNSVVDNLLGSRPSTNIFTSDYYIAIRDISGVERDLSIIEAEITQLQNDVSGIEIEIEDISNGYLKLSGGTITGELTLESDFLCKRITSKEDIIIADPNGGVKGRLAQADNKFFIQSADGGELIVFSKYDQGASVLDIDTSNNILNTENVAIKTTDYADLNATVKQNLNDIFENRGRINQNTSLAESKLSVSGGTMTGSINMNGTHRIQNSAPPTAIGDLTNKQYVDGNITSAIGDLSNNVSNTYLPLSGGTLNGNLDIEGTIILEGRLSFIDDKIKIGDAGINSQGEDAIAIGTQAGFQNQGAQAVAIGIQTGATNQGAQTVAIGSNSARTNQKDYGIAIGAETAFQNQGNGSVALGQSAGYQNQGDYSIAIGAKAGFQDQSANSIALNATNVSLNPSTSGLYVKPVRNATTSDALYYDATSGEVSYGDIPTPPAQSFPFSNTKQVTLSTFPVNPNPNQNVVCNLPADFDHTKNYVSFKFIAQADAPPLGFDYTIKLDLKYVDGSSTLTPVTVSSTCDNPFAVFKPLYIRDIYFGTSNPTSTNGVANAFSIELSNTSNPAIGIDNLKYLITYTIQRVSSTFDTSVNFDKANGYTNVDLNFSPVV